MEVRSEREWTSMTQAASTFREFGIIPDLVKQPAEVVRAWFSLGQVIGQYVATGMILSFGLALAALFWFTIEPPFHGIMAVLPLMISTGLAFLVGRNDYVWVELDGETLRAKHLYTRRVTVRPVREIEDLLTIVLRVQNLTTTIVNSWLGRVRGIEIRFQDGRSPIRVSRVDPKMTNAQELMEAIVYRMSQIGPIDAEVVDFNGSPLLRRIHWVKPV